jgi:hypothetical protein
MATEDRNEPLAAIDLERLDMAIKAAAAIGQIAGPLQRMTAGHADAEVDTAHQLAIRIEQLASVVLSALDDQDTPADATLAEAREVLLGPEMHRQRVREAANA